MNQTESSAFDSELMAGINGGNDYGFMRRHGGAAVADPLARLVNFIDAEHEQRMGVLDENRYGNDEQRIAALRA